MTSSAVKGLPLWNVTPGRRWISHTVALLFFIHLSAGPGAIVRSGLTRTSGSYRLYWRDVSMNDEPRPGLNVSPLPAPAWPTRRVPPRLIGVASGAADALSAPWGPTSPPAPRARPAPAAPATHCLRDRRRSAST